MTADEKRIKAVAWLRSRGRYIAEGNPSEISWNPSTVDVRTTIQREQARITGKEFRVVRGLR